MKKSELRQIFTRQAMLLLMLGAMSHSRGEPIPLNTPTEFQAGVKGAIELTFPTEMQKYYQIQFSADLNDWDNEGYSFKGTGGQIAKLVSLRGRDRAFFRVKDDGLVENLAPSSIHFVDQIVYQGGILNDWSVLDISQHIGVNRKLCLFEVTKTSGSVAFDIKLLPNGKEYPAPPWVGGSGFYAFGCGAGSFTNAGKENSPLRLYLVCHTDEDGKIIWKTNSQGAEITIRLTAVF